MTEPKQDLSPVLSESTNLLLRRPNETRFERQVRLAARLMQLGVSRSQITQLLLHDLDQVERQLDWLPYRRARKRSSLIVSAIEQDFEAPADWSPDEE